MTILSISFSEVPLSMGLGWLWFRIALTGFQKDQGNLIFEGSGFRHVAFNSGCYDGGGSLSALSDLP